MCVQDTAVASACVRVPVREGSLIVWDVRLVHGSSPDHSPQGVQTRPRFVQFVSLRTCRLLGAEQVRRLSQSLGLGTVLLPVGQVWVERWHHVVPRRRRGLKARAMIRRDSLIHVASSWVTR